MQWCFISKGFSFFNAEKFISAGIGVAAMYYGDIEPDFMEGIKYGIRGYYLKPGQNYTAPDEWGAISAWSWGLSCAMDYLETAPQVNSGVTAWRTENVLGITIVEPGCRTLKIEPHRGNPEWIEGTFPSPMGLVTVKHTRLKNGKIKTEINAPEGKKII